MPASTKQWRQRCFGHRGRRTPCAGRGGAEDGQSMILIIGFTVIILLAVSATLAATAVNAEARKLLSVADSAVAAAADSFSVRNEGEVRDVGLFLSGPAVHAAAAQYVNDVGAAATFEGFAISAATADSAGTTAYVRLRAVVRPPLVGWFVPGGIPITVESSSRTSLTR